jgi:class 3 adenylate cyclase/CheY-like chemotaxis protein
MTPPSPLPDEAAKDRAAAAWLAQTQQELVAPAHALRERAAMLAEDVQPHGPPGLYADLHTIQAVGQHLEDLIHDLIPTLTDPAKLARDAPALTKLRHDLRTPLHQIIGYCDLWLEDEDEAAAIERFCGDLESLRSTGRELNARVEKLRALDPDQAESGSADGDSEAIERMVQEWAATRPVANRTEVVPGRLLVVDDNDFNRDVLARRLERQGHVVVQAVNGKRALECLAHDEFDLVLLDILMPEMNGLEVLQRLKADERWRHLPVIMVSALNDIDGVAHCLTLGADDYLPRPYNQAILRARIDALLERKRLRDREIEHLDQIRAEKERVDALLHVIMPHEVVGELQATGSVRPRRYERVAVLFADIVGFTPYCDAHSPEEVVRGLRRLVEHFEQAAMECGVQKIKTIGDAFMAAAGLFRATDNPVLDCVRCGAAMLSAAAAVAPHWSIRIGIHSGSVIGGVVGARQYLFDIWGDTVNTASRVEHHGQPGQVTLSAEAWSSICHCCRGDSRGAIEMKGKGAMELVQFEEFL